VSALLTALGSVALAALVALAGYAGGGVMVAAVALTVLVVAVGWAGLLGLPDARGSAVVIALTGWAALAAAAFNRYQARPLAVFTSVVAFAVLLAFAHELLRRDGRPELVESVTGTLAGQVVAILGAGWVLLPDTAAGVAAVALTAVALGAARLVAAVRMPLRVLGWVQLALGGAAGSVVAVLLARSSLQAGIAAALAVAAVVAALDHVLADLGEVRTRLGLVAAASAPVTAVGMVGYGVIRLLAG
jgi:hypothetical protein